METTDVNQSTEPLKMEEESHGYISLVETRDSSRSLQNGNVESQKFYRHGAQVEPLRRPFFASELGREH